MDNKKIIGMRINEALALRNKKQKELAAILNVTDNTISYFCSGTRTPNTQQIVEISKYLDVSTDYLLGLTEYPTSDKDKAFICEYTGLSADAVEILNRHQRYTNALSHLNMFIENSFYIFNYLDEYIKSVCYCGFLEQTHPKIDFSARSLGIIINSKTGEIKNRTISKDEEEARNAYFEHVDKEQPLHLYHLQKMFIEFVEKYGRHEKENINVDEFNEQLARSENQKNALSEDLASSMDRLKASMSKFAGIIAEDGDTNG